MQSVVWMHWSLKITHCIVMQWSSNSARHYVKNVVSVAEGQSLKPIYVAELNQNKSFWLREIN